MLAGAVLLPPQAAPPAPPASPPRPRPLLPSNVDAADTSNVDDLLAAGSAGGYALTGHGVRVGIWDDGAARVTHADLRDRVEVIDDSPATDHATHTAGTILGTGTGDASARGMAPAATALSGSWVDGPAELADYAGMISVSNHAYNAALGWFDDPACDALPSWVGGSDFADPFRGKYGDDAAAIDAVAFAADALIVWSAGNNRRDVLSPAAAHHHYPSCTDVYTDDHAAQDAYDTIGGAAAAKNVITVGAIGDLTDDPVPASQVQPLYFSGFGPSDDGRVKPDVVASGFSVYSALAGTDDAHGSFTGTSPATAVVTGGIALLVERYRALNHGVDPRAADIKALVVQTALDDADLPGPDAETGYGLFDARAAAALLEHDALAAGARLRAGVFDGAAQAFTTLNAVAAGTPLRATLAWIDPPAPPNGGGLDDPSPALVDDLDLVLVAPDGVTQFHAWSLDAGNRGAPATRTALNHLDPTEVVSVDAVDNVWTGNWTLRVSGATNDGSARAYALACGQALTAAPAPVLALPRYVDIDAQLGGSRADVVVPVRNLGSGRLTFEVTDAPSWLSAAPAAGQAPAEIHLAIDATALAAGEQRGVLVVDSNDASGPRSVAITLRFAACLDACAGRSCGADPVCGESCGSCAAGSVCADGACVDDPCAEVDCGACAICSGGACLPVHDGEACDDADACTHGDVCSAGSCEGVPACDAGGSGMDGGPGTAAERDAGRRPDPEDGGEADAAMSANNSGDGSGCGCRTHVAGTPRSALPGELVLALAVVLRRRRKARARAPG
jgi:hypothetical protein